MLSPQWAAESREKHILRPRHGYLRTRLSAYCYHI
jgi:hypothetical protein